MAARAPAPSSCARGSLAGPPPRATGDIDAAAGSAGSARSRCKRRLGAAGRLKWPLLLLGAALAYAAPATCSAPAQWRRCAAPGEPCAAAPEQPEDAGPLVQTKRGTFKGLLEPANGVVAFLGIRYASAPTKRMRFMPPSAHQYAANQVHRVQQFGPICRQRWPVQLDAPTLARLGRLAGRGARRPGAPGVGAGPPAAELSPADLQLRLIKAVIPRHSFASLRHLFRQLAGREQSEDCLNLNIYSPASAPLAGSEAGARSKGASLRPVLVIIHGESYDYGAGSALDPSAFVRDNQVIAVTMNYRLNILGFPPPTLAGASRANLGLMDQVAALHWIKDNIEAFGGSPHNITLMGTKRGAVFVNLLMMSPMAKDLFRRAVMEDGSGLTPLVASYLSAASGPGFGAAAGGAPAGQLQQHFRLLGMLNNCTADAPPTQAAAPAPRKSNLGGALAPANATEPEEVGFLLQQQQQQQQQHFSRRLGRSPEAAQWSGQALADCLRQRPAEQLLHSLPLELVQVRPSDNLFGVQRRWLQLAGLNQSLQRRPDGGEAEAERRASEEQAPPEAAGEPDAHAAVPLTRDLLQRLIEQSALRQLLADDAYLAEDSQEAYDDDGGGEDDTDGGDDSRQLPSTGRRPPLDELFGAIYGDPAANLMPLFGPTVDGAVVPGAGNGDLALAMLAPGSSFGQRDLLIGFGQRWEAPEAGPPALGAGDHWPSEPTRRAGLSNEQALQLVNRFVRATYRFHQQEIANSIINNYLARPTAAAAAYPAQGGERRQPEVPRTGRPLNRGSPQLQLLHSLMEALRDSVTDVPILKTGIIHAVKQLEPIASAFLQVLLNEPRAERPGKPAAAAATATAAPKQAQLAERFSLFAQKLLDSSQYKHSGASSTFLYQLDTLPWLEHLRRLVASAHSEAKRDGSWPAIKETLQALLGELQRSRAHLVQFQSIGCVLKLAELEQVRASSLFRRFNSWLCRKSGENLAKFVISGDLNAPERHQQQWQPSSHLEQLEARAKLERSLNEYDARCGSGGSLGSDHHSTRALSAAAGDRQWTTGMQEEGAAGCQEQLNSLAIEFIQVNLAEPAAGSSQGAQRWPVFSPFASGQWLASLPAPTRSLWQPGELAARPASFGEPLVARSSFWANFLPTLNCSRTQPILPSQLASAANGNASSGALLSLNLAFSCQSSATKTPRDIMEQTLMNIKQQNEAARLEQLQQTGRPAHGLLLIGSQQSQRMLQHGAGASSSRTGDEPSSAESAVSSSKQQQVQLQERDSHSFTKSTTSSNTSAIRSTSHVNDDDYDESYRAVHLRTKYAGLVLAVSGLLLVSSLVYGARVALTHRRDRRKRASMVADEAMEAAPGPIPASCLQPDRMSKARGELASLRAAVEDRVSCFALDDQVSSSPQPPVMNGYLAGHSAALKEPPALELEEEDEEEDENENENLKKSLKMEQLEQRNPAPLPLQMLSSELYPARQQEETDGAMSKTAAYVYWDANLGQPFLNSSSLNLCRSHSSVNVLANGLLAFDGANFQCEHNQRQTPVNTTNESLLNLNKGSTCPHHQHQNQPFFMALSSSDSNRSEQQNHARLFTDSQLFVDKASGANRPTKREAAAGLSYKKRVKIRDPAATMAHHRPQTTSTNRLVNQVPKTSSMSRINGSSCYVYPMSHENL